MDLKCKLGKYISNLYSRLASLWYVLTRLTTKVRSDLLLNFYYGSFHAVISSQLQYERYGLQMASDIEPIDSACEPVLTIQNHAILQKKVVRFTVHNNY